MSFKASGTKLSTSYQTIYTGVTNGSVVHAVHISNVHDVAAKKITLKYVDDSASKTTTILDEFSIPAKDSYTHDKPLNLEVSDTLKALCDEGVLADTVSVTSASAVMTGVADTSVLSIGMKVEGTNIPEDTRILTIDSGTQITMDTNASGTNASESADFISLEVTLSVLDN